MERRYYCVKCGQKKFVFYAVGGSHWCRDCRNLYYEQYHGAGGINDQWTAFLKTITESAVKHGSDVLDVSLGRVNKITGEVGPPALEEDDC